MPNSIETPNEESASVLVATKRICRTASTPVTPLFHARAQSRIVHARGTLLLDFLGVARERHSGNETAIETSPITLDFLDHGVACQVRSRQSTMGPVSAMQPASQPKLMEVRGARRRATSSGVCDGKESRITEKEFTDGGISEGGKWKKERKTLSDRNEGVEGLRLTILEILPKQQYDCNAVKLYSYNCNFIGLYDDKTPRKRTNMTDNLFNYTFKKMLHDCAVDKIAKSLN